jgi:CubicO group peptidase (beta-lactamase class C family)
VASTFARILEREGELGGSFCVTRDGQAVVDIWGGFADAARTKPWRSDTLVNVWSTTKGMLALCIARLTDQGLLAYDRAVSDYWPAFAANGKGEITVSQLFSHQAGICGPTRQLKEDDFYAVEELADLLAAEAPQWDPGSRSGYHALSIGYLGHGLVRRVTGKSVGEYFRDEIGAPLSVDFHMGVGPADVGRIAEIAHDGQPMSGGEAAYNVHQTRAHVYLPIRPGIANDPRWQATGIASAGGCGSARALARVYGALATDRRIEGVELVSERALAAATTPQIENEDLVLRIARTWGIGFVLNKGSDAYGPNPKAFGHRGWGGSFAFADPEHRIGVAYAMNFMREPVGADDQRFASLVKVLYGCL